MRQYPKCIIYWIESSIIHHEYNKQQAALPAASLGVAVAVAIAIATWPFHKQPEFFHVKGTMSRQLEVTVRWNSNGGKMLASA
jgi:hypothetical protein